MRDKPLGSARSSRRKSSVKRTLSVWLRLPLRGSLFKLYAPRLRGTLDSVATAKPAGRPIHRLLIANLMPSLGDTICYLPLVDLLAAARPETEITWLAESTMASLVSLHSGIAHVLPVPIASSPLMRIPIVKSYYRLFRTMQAIYKLRPLPAYDTVIVPRGGVDPCFSAHAAWILTSSPSYGYSTMVEPDEIDHNGGDCLLTHVSKTIDHQHESRRAIWLLQFSGLLPPGDVQWSEFEPIHSLQQIAKMQDTSLLFTRLAIEKSKPYIVLCPGAGMEKKRWPANNYHSLCKRLLADHSVQLVLTGSKAERSLCTEVMNHLPPMVHNCAGLLSLADLIALISQAALFIGNDSGTGHVAGALGISTVSIHVQPRRGDPFHISAPDHYRPVGPHVIVLQPDDLLAPCVDRCEASAPHCITQITVDRVWNAILPSLNRINLSPQVISLLPSELVAAGKADDAAGELGLEFRASAVRGGEVPEQATPRRLLKVDEGCARHHDTQGNVT